eukprot:TRINITY_DN14498_c0_g1_i1.p1 TRINITY_DN14498_c0_g1~~TRINITY_DN14498_c0_g1_i1.p1  ORF type:complete len:339 (-),score=91.46 TRINITY_DN14498_c0_g1_i1:126-1142(-)
MLKFKEWNFPVLPCNIKLSMVGYSRSAEATGFYIPELDIGLDAGLLATTARPIAVFISHSHTDHIHMLTHFVSRSKPPYFYVPEETSDLVKNYLWVSQELTDNQRKLETDEPWTTNHYLKPVKPLDILNFQMNSTSNKKKKKKNLNWYAKVFKCFHTVPCVGYGFYYKTNKLKDEYKTLTGKEIGNLRRNKVEVTEEIHHPMFCFLGDTTTEVLETYPELLKFKVVIIEATFLEEDKERNAIKAQHVWYNNLKPYIVDNPETTFVLIHFSRRYKSDFVLNFFENENLPNVVPWVELYVDHLQGGGPVVPISSSSSSKSNGSSNNNVNNNNDQSNNNNK